MIYFLHHHDRTNQGDVLSGPYNYFDFGRYEKVSWDTSIVGPENVSVSASDAVIMGGGIYFTANKWKLAKMMKAAGAFIGWGIGLDPRTEDKEFVDRFTLLGTRERKSEYIDNERVFYMPCSSCMNAIFDETEASGGAVPKAVSARKIAIHTNASNADTTALGKRADGEQIVWTKTISTFDETIANIKSAECVVTNSYHGAYWASLFGKKVVCLKTEVPKWDGLHENVVFASIDEVDDAIAAAKRVPFDYLVECRTLNRSFYKRVQDLLSLTV
ncbi:polysaccharide pyruvyl transferase family protein [Salipiger abyssi]|uniref:polysaccharide pyruvyl transferase family protein n=1 Tax=Salipiger abyssi TaxID=1250539 RepID=UPI001A8FD3FF|nr:polysaccharide pyruvyl transferase family protein [Salipiger abyssi]MBN9889830.1 polysaccharide pyruvyl transferase family protein [Salipiger abyssi]